MESQQLISDISAQTVSLEQKIKKRQAELALIAKQKEEAKERKKKKKKNEEEE